MSEEEFFNAMDMDIDLSFLQPADSPQSRPADTKFPTKVSSGDINVSSRTLIEHQDERKIEPTLSHIASPHDQQLPNQQPETSVLAHTTNPTNIAAVTTVTAAAVPTKSLATWTFNKRKRKRIYVSLTGKKLTGPEAIRQCREDKANANHPFRLARAELIQAVALHPSHVSSSSTPSSTPCQGSTPMNAEGGGDYRHYLQLTDWGVPISTAARYAEWGNVRSMFPWQAECLSTDGGDCVLRGRNLIYSAPTSGGKTLVAEILMLRRLGGQGHQQSGDRESKTQHVMVTQQVNTQDLTGVILFVVPFISLAEEKAIYFQDRWKLMFIGVRSFHGEDDGALLTDDVDVAVCTFEKANVLINQLLDEGRESRLTMVVVDELHLVSDTQRGFLLEVLLTKVKHCMPHCQLVGMSATLPNMGDLAKWLDASLYITTYRPVQLAVRVCCERKLFEIKSEILKNSESGSGEMSFRLDRAVPTLQAFHQRSQQKHERSKQPPGVVDDDTEGFLSLVLETLLIKKSVMVFCNSKRRCELCVDRVTKMIYSTENKQLDTSTASKAKRLELLQQLRETPVGLCPLLHTSVLAGVAYHHAGLTMDERKLLEEAYRTGVLVVLCTTSTLAAGVNLPAHRVIVRTPTMGMSELSIAAFRQMCGRAGRLGLDECGEAVLMLPNSSRAMKELAVHLVTAPMPPLLSSLQTANGGGLEKLLLEMIYCQKIKCVTEVQQFVACTLLNVQKSQSDVATWTQQALLFLQHHHFLLQYKHDDNTVACELGAQTQIHTRDPLQQSSVGGQLLAASPLGRATTLSGISPKDAVLVLSSLQQARQQLILQSGFHVVFLVTPPSTHINPQWDSYESLLDGVLKDHPGIGPVVDLLGASRGDLCTYKHSPPKFNCTKPKSLFYKRFYSALLLFNLIQEIPLNRISQWVDIQRGQIQQLQKEASAFCGMIVSFCDKLNWISLSCVLATYTSRLMFGVRPELLPLTRLGPEMPGFRARAFFKSGIKSIEDIVSSNPDFLRDILLDCLPFEGTDPLCAGKNKTKISTTGKSSSGNGGSGGVGGKSRQHEEQSCTSLALRIIKLAKLKVEEDIELQFQEQTLLQKMN